MRVDAQLFGHTDNVAVCPSRPHPTSQGHGEGRNSAGKHSRLRFLVRSPDRHRISIELREGKTWSTRTWVVTLKWSYWVAISVFFSVCDPAGMGLDMFLFRTDANDVAKNVQCIYTSAFVGPVNKHECHQNWLMGEETNLPDLAVDSWKFFFCLKATVETLNQETSTSSSCWISCCTVTAVILTIRTSSATRSTRVRSIMTSKPTTSITATCGFLQTCRQTSRWATWSLERSELEFNLFELAFGLTFEVYSSGVRGVFACPSTAVYPYNQSWWWFWFLEFNKSFKFVSTCCCLLSRQNLADKSESFGWTKFFRRNCRLRLSVHHSHSNRHTECSCCHKNIAQLPRPHKKLSHWMAKLLSQTLSLKLFELKMTQRSMLLK